MTFTENNKIVVGNVPGAALVDDALHPASAAFIDMSAFLTVAFVVILGAVADAVTFQVQQDTSATATGNIKDVTGATVTIAGTDDNKMVVIEVAAQNLDATNGFRYVTLKASGIVGTNNAAVLAVLSEPRSAKTTWNNMAVAPVIVAG